MGLPVIDLRPGTDHSRCGVPDSRRDLSGAATSDPAGWHNARVSLEDYPGWDIAANHVVDIADEDNFFLQLE